MYKIQISNVKKTFGNKEVLKSVNLNIKKGESLVVIGGSGAGKSVLMKSVAQLYEPTSGSIIIDGVETVNNSDKEKNKIMEKIGFLFQGGALFDSLKIWENIAFQIINNKKISSAKAKEIASDKLRVVGLSDDVMNLYPSELSGGMQKRVSLARTIAHTPEIIFFDEPTTGLDPIMSDVINDLIIKSSKQIGATTLTITHDIASARKIADNIAMLYKGQIIWQGTPDDLDTTDNPYIRQFISGDSHGIIEIVK